VQGDFTVVETLDEVFPKLSVSDYVFVSPTEVDGHPAWFVKLTLDYASHPGEKVFDRNIIVVPLKKGFAVHK